MGNSALRMGSGAGEGQGNCAGEAQGWTMVGLGWAQAWITELTGMGTWVRKE